MQEYASLERKAERQTATQPRKRIKTRYSNKTKVFLCYLLVWGLALAIPLAGLVWVYPYKLIGTAPAVAENVTAALPFLAESLHAQVSAAALQAGMDAQGLAQALGARDLQWQAFVGGSVALCWAMSLLMQLIWRGFYRHPVGAARATRRAIRTYRLTLLAILLLNALGGLLLYLLGIQFVGGRTLWDWLVYMNGFGLNVIAAFLSFRLAAPPAISGKHSFFKRL